MNKKVAFIIALLTIGIASRLIPHYPNFTAIGAMALMSGAMLKRPLESIVIPFAALFLSDVFINNVLYPAEGFTLFYSSAAYVYGAVLVTILAARIIKKLNVKNYLFLAIGASILFFLITNFGTWATGIIYPRTTQGLFAAYAAGLPYAVSYLAGTVVYGVLVVIAYGALIGERKTEFARI